MVGETGTKAEPLESPLPCLRANGATTTQDDLSAPPADGAHPVFAGSSKSRPLGHKVIRGAFWTILGALLNKGVTAAGQIALAWFLVPEDFGLVAMAVSMTAIASLLTSGGLQAILIQRPPKDFHRLAGQVFWLSLALNSLAGMVVLALAPASNWIFHDPRVGPLVAIVGLTLPLGAFTTVYAAKLYTDLRFRTVALIQLGEGIIQTGSAILLAYAGFGAYALVLPQLWVRVYAGLTARMAAGRIPLGRPSPSTWAVLIAPAAWLMLQAMLNALQANGPNLIIGLFHSPRVTGLYFWGYQLAAQAVFLLAVQLHQVLFPSLSKLSQEPGRQFDGFRQALRSLSALILPICALQAMLAGPVIELIFGDRWRAAIPVVQWLSLGMATVSLQVLGTSLLMARGNFSTLTYGLATSACLVFGACWLGSFLGQAPTIAACIAAAMILGHVLILFLACHALGQNLLGVLGDLSRPVALTAVVAPCVWLSLAGFGSPLAQAVVGLSAFALLYGAGARFLLWNELRLVITRVQLALHQPH